MKGDKIVVGITQGDINGIGYEVIIKTLSDSRIYDFCIPVVYGSPKVAAYHRKALNLENFSFNTIRGVEEASAKRASIINCTDDTVRVELGKSTPIAGEASYKALEAAAQDLAHHKIDALVTAPINKSNIQSEKFQYAGHTEFFEAQFSSGGVLMVMINDLFRIGVVTTHVPINKITEYITKDSVLNKVRILHRSLMIDFRITNPRIAILGLNPHAGDEGLLGEEEQKEIIPALEAARVESVSVFGPFPADGFFGAGMYKKFDAILAMYHDQGLIPFKALTEEGGVNFTAGLPIVRTSPSHGTAFDIAGKGEASSDSFRKALYMACDVFKNRKEYTDISGNPLKPFDGSELQNS